MVSLALRQPEPQLHCAALAAWKHHLCFGLHTYLCRGTDSAFAQRQGWTVYSGPFFLPFLAPVSCSTAYSECYLIDLFI